MWITVRLWMTWIIANTLGGLVGFGAGGAVTAAALGLLGLLHVAGSRRWSEVILVVVCASAWPAIVGGIVALAQWLVLRASLGGLDMTGWLRTNVILWLAGTVAAIIFGALVELIVGNRFGGVPSLLVSGLVLAVPIAIGQWGALNTCSANAAAWVPAVVVGYTAGALLGASAAGAMLSGVVGNDWVATLVVAPSVAGAVGGCVSGLVTGLALIRLVRAAARPD